MARMEKQIATEDASTLTFSERYFTGSDMLVRLTNPNPDPDPDPNPNP